MLYIDFINIFFCLFKLGLEIFIGFCSMCLAFSLSINQDEFFERYTMSILNVYMSFEKIYWRCNLQTKWKHIEDKYNLRQEKTSVNVISEIIISLSFLSQREMSINSLFLILSKLISYSNYRISLIHINPMLSRYFLPNGEKLF